MLAPFLLSLEFDLTSASDSPINGDGSTVENLIRDICERRK